VNIVVLGELLAGFRCGTREAENRQELEQFLNSPRVEILSIDEETADFYATVFRALKDKGRPIPSNDLWIAASTLRHGLALATLDEHFRNIDGLLLTSI
jgi:tRNA(fMet)-specific endonuclease VapC